MKIPKSFSYDLSKNEDGTFGTAEAQPVEYDAGPKDNEQQPSPPGAGDPQGAEPSPLPSPTPGAEPAPAGTPPILGKFNSQADLEAAYVELERRLGGAPPAEAEPQPEDEAAPEAAPEADDSAAPPQAEQFAALVQEYQTQGKLSDDSYANLANEHGLTREVVDEYIQGRVALAERETVDLLKSCGVSSLDEYKQMTAWAEKNMTPEEIQAFNGAMGGSDRGTTASFVSGLVARYKQANRPVRRVAGKPSRAPAVAPFSTVQEMQRAMSDPRYNYDEAYRQSVGARMDASTILDGQVRTSSGGRRPRK